MLGRKSESVLHEYQIERNTEGFLREHKYCFALCSSTDSDRLASFHAACKNTGRVFCVDKYQKGILDVFSQYAGRWSGIYRFDHTFELIKRDSPKVMDKLSREGFLMPIRMSGEDTVRKMIGIYADEPAWLIYSMWSGYSEQGKDYTMNEVLDIRSIFGDRILDGTKDGVHTSGHADVGALQEVCSMVNPKIGVIPIHKENGARYDSLPNVDGYRIFTEGYHVIDNIKIVVK